VSLRRALWISIVVMLTGAAAMLLGTAPRIEAGGLAPFDTRTDGYAFDEALAFPTALTPEGRAVYLTWQRAADTVFPVGFLGVLALGNFLTWRRWSRVLALVLTVPPLVYFVFDMLENAAVADILRTAPEAVTREAVAWASSCTIWKFHFVDAALATLLAGLVARGVARLAGR